MAATQVNPVSASEFALRDDAVTPPHERHSLRRTSDGANDPFANSSPIGSPTTSEPRRGSSGSDQSANGAVPIAKRDRRLSKEWDAAKTPPSRFQKVEGSIYATPNSRDGHIARNKIHGFKEKVKELGGLKK